MSENKRWVKCPCCSEEYLKLRPCNYLDDQMRPALSYLCVICAETLVAWEWIVSRMPLPTGALSYTKWTAPRYQRLSWKEGDQVDRPRNAYVMIEIGGMEVAARSDGTGTPIRYKVKGSDDVRMADNIYQLRSKVINTVPY